MSKVEKITDREAVASIQEKLSKALSKYEQVDDMLDVYEANKATQEFSEAEP